MGLTRLGLKSRPKMAVYVTGDKHGEMEMYHLQKKHRPISLTEDDILIIAGDFGLLWSDPPRLKAAHWLRYLEQAKWTTLFVDGNHENFDLINKLPEEYKWGGYVGKVHDKLYHLKRGEVYEIQGHKILTFGGALSIDKMYRQMGISWWPEELPNHKETEHCIDNIIAHDNKVDYVITHTCPQEVAEIMAGKYRFEKIGDPTGKILSHISSMVECKQWLFGHWHVNVTLGKYRCLWHDFVKLD